MSKTLDPARLRRARLVELDFVRRDILGDTHRALAKMREALDSLRDEIEKSKELVRK